MATHLLQSSPNPAEVLMVQGEVPGVSTDQHCARSFIHFLLFNYSPHS